MKKFLMFLMSLMLLVGVSSCTTCSRKDATPVVEQQKAELVVEHLVALDRQDLYFNYAKQDGSKCRWFETCVVLTDFLDEEGEHAVAGVSNVFQIVEVYGQSADTYVVLYAHTPDSSATDVKHGFWVEDYPLNDEAVVVTFKEALEKVYETNLPKPHSRQVVLRQEIGPKAANPQWIFGNSHAQIYVDAVTGKVSSINPAFDVKFGTPLGEWP